MPQWPNGQTLRWIKDKAGPHGHTWAMNISQDTHVADLAATFAAAIPIFERHGLDYCCGGKRPLGEACLASGVDPAVVQAELEAAANRDSGAPANWNVVPLAAIIDHIVVRFHDPERAELVRLEALAAKVASKHGDRFPEIFPRLHDLVRGVREGMVPHMASEEDTLFPQIRSLEEQPHAPSVALEQLLPTLVNDHIGTGELLNQIRHITSNYQPPADVCPSFRGLYAGLEALEQDIHGHVFMEHQFLFPRAVELDASR